MFYVYPTITSWPIHILQAVNREMKVKAKNDTEYYLVEVIAHILKYLKDELIKKLKRAEYHLEATDFDWGVVYDPPVKSSSLAHTSSIYARGVS